MRAKIDERIVTNLSRFGYVSLGAILGLIPAFINRIESDLAIRLVNKSPLVKKVNSDPRLRIEDFYNGENIKKSDELWDAYKKDFLRNNPDPGNYILSLRDLDGNKFTGPERQYQTLETRI